MPPKSAIKLCCICKTRKSKEYRRSEPFEPDFECCFGPSVEGRTGRICSTCKNCVEKYRKNRDLGEDNYPFERFVDRYLRSSPGAPKKNRQNVCSNSNDKHCKLTETVDLDSV